LQAAVTQSGAARATLLDRAIECVESELGSMHDRGDDPVLHFYADAIEEILQLSRKDSELAERYRLRRKTRDEWISSEAIFTQLKTFDATQDYAGAISFIMKCLEATQDDTRRWRLESARQVYLEWSHRYDEALAHCRRLLELDTITVDQREWLLDREAFNLFCLDRVEEGLAHYDRRIAAAEDSPQRRLYLLGWKAQMVINRDPVLQSIEACQEYRNATQHGTSDWREATGFLAQELLRAERHEESLTLVNALLREDRNTWLLLAAAESYIALGKHAEANRAIEDARSMNHELANSARQSEREQHDAVATRIDELMQKMSEQDTTAESNRTER